MPESAIIYKDFFASIASLAIFILIAYLVVFYDRTDEISEQRNYCNNNGGLLHHFPEKIPQDILDELNIKQIELSDLYLLNENYGYRFVEIDSLMVAIANMYGRDFPTKFIIDMQDEPNDPKIVYCNKQNTYYKTSSEKLIPYEKRESFYKLRILIASLAYEKIWEHLFYIDCDDQDTSYLRRSMDSLYDIFSLEEKLDLGIFPYHCERKNKKKIET